MIQEDKNIREKLILATLDCIQKKGMHSVTIRNIAKEAGVNSAAINYYFGTKENLVETAMKKAMENAMANFEMLNGQDQNLYESIRSFYLHTFEGMMNYPEITKALLYTSFTRNEYDEPILIWLRSFMGQFVEKFGLLHMNSTDQEIKYTIMQMLSVILLPSIFPKIFQEMAGSDFKNPEVQKGYIDFLLSHYLKSK